MQDKKDLLLVFVHGFMGSEQSFGSFPTDLCQLLNENGLQVDALVYPSYDTSGNNQKLVQKLMDWLMVHGSSAKYQHVFILAHSMGGLLAADAYRYLYHVELIKEDNPSLLGKISSKVGSLFSYAPHESRHDPNDMRFLVNLSGVLAFDSPYFGVHSNVYLSTAVEKSKQVIAEIPKIVPKDLAAPAVQLIPEQVAIPTPIKDVNIPVSTKWIKDSIESNLPGGPSISQMDHPPTIKNISKPPTGAYVASTIVKDSVGASHFGLSTGIQAVNKLIEFQSFLDPVLNSHTQCLERIQILAQEHSKTRKLYFKSFFNVLHPKERQPELLVNPKLEPGSRVFCITPPEGFEEHFKTLPSPLEDEIDAHMNMFDRQMLGGEHYFWLLEYVAYHVVEGVSHL